MQGGIGSAAPKRCMENATICLYNIHFGLAPGISCPLYNLRVVIFADPATVSTWWKIPRTSH